MILITGATGLCGQLIVREFARERHPVRALVRSLDRARQAQLDRLGGVMLAEGDMNRRDQMAPIVEGVDQVLMISTGAPDMVETQCRFIDACKTSGVRHVVKFSGRESGTGFDPAKFRFTRMHEEIEGYLEASGLDWTHLRPAQFMQTYLREAADVVRGALRLPFGGIRLSPIDAQDIARIAFRLLCDGGHAGERLDMTGPEALTMDQIAERLSQATGRQVAYEPIGREERRDALLARGIPVGFVEALDEQAAERNKCPESRVDLEVHRAFGVVPTSFAEFAKRHAAIFRGE